MAARNLGERAGGQIDPRTIPGYEPVGKILLNLPKTILTSLTEASLGMFDTQAGSSNGTRRGSR